MGCVAGAPLVTETERMMREAGLVEIALEPKPEYVETMGRRNHRSMNDCRAHPRGHDPGRLLTSLNITRGSPNGPRAAMTDF